ncbi:hypothetical protein QFC19_002464 [Naganishia cerealis]|uniref:Uncharacterized protein n=1 Tax=Naganishia cerealis TaxID=610337 RepID=A0ACC2W9A2_9TREE|nr:hypothetical protein QFC19_002464 [Naganishia cerealis]
MAENTRTSARRAHHAPPVPSVPPSTTKLGKRGTKRAADGAPVGPAPMVDEDGIKQSLGFVWDSAGQVKEEDSDGSVVGAAGDTRVVGKKEKRRLLAVLTALSLPPDDSEIQDDAAATAVAAAKKKAKLLQLLLDQAFLPSTEGEADSQSTKAKPGTTLRSMLTRDETLEMDDLLCQINALAAALVPDIPEPFSTVTKEHIAAPAPNTRLPGSRAKPIKDAPLIDALHTLRDVINTILAPRNEGTSLYSTKGEEKGEPRDAQKGKVVQWALHQRLIPPPSTASTAGAGKGKPPMIGWGGDWFSGLTEVVDIAADEEDKSVDGEGKMDVDGKEDEESLMLRMERSRAFVQYPRYTTAFTPSFAPTHDSSTVANEWGYFSTWDAACMRARLGRWRGARWGKRFERAWEEAEEALLEMEDEDGVEQEQEPVVDRPRATKSDISELLAGLLPSSASTSPLSSAEEDDVMQDKESEHPAVEIDPALVNAVDEIQEEMRAVQGKLDRNAVWVRQLQTFQEIRVRTGQRTPLEEEERVVELASATTPAALLPRSITTNSQSASVPLAITLAHKVIHTPGPNVRGTLDPARPKAMVDNTTAVAKPPGQVAPAPAVASAATPNVRASPAPGMAARAQNARGGWAGPIPTTQQRGIPPVNGPIAQPAAGMYGAPQARQASRYTFPPQSNPAGMHSSFPASAAGMGGRSSPIAPMNSVPSVLRNALPQPVGLGSFSPMGRSTLAPTTGVPNLSMTTGPAATAGMMAGNPVSAMYTSGGGQQGRGIGSSMGISMNNPGRNSSPAPAFRPSNSMRGSV